MKTVLFAWELGGGLGHVGALRLVARRLAAEGVRAVFALRDVAAAPALLSPADGAVVQAPVWWEPSLPVERPYGASSYADILAMFGYASRAGLGALVSAWDSLFAAYMPDLVVADHAPTALLAAAGAVPAVALGNGFTLPPADLAEFPILRPHLAPLTAQSALLEAVAAVQHARRRPAPAALPGVLAASRRFVCVYPELDCYAAVRREAVLGPLEPVPDFSPAPLAPAIFAYIAPDYWAIDKLIEAIVATGARAEIYVRGIGGGVFARLLAARGAVVHERPPPLAEVVPRASVVVSHGGTATTHAALAAGRPQLLLPPSLEMDLTARAVEGLSLGIRLEPATPPDVIARELGRLLAEPKWRDHATFWAKRRAEEARPPALDQVLEACRALLA